MGTTYPKDTDLDKTRLGDVTLDNFLTELVSVCVVKGIHTGSKSYGCKNWQDVDYVLGLGEYLELSDKHDVYLHSSYYKDCRSGRSFQALKFNAIYQRKDVKFNVIICGEDYLSSWEFCNECMALMTEAGDLCIAEELENKSLRVAVFNAIQAAFIKRMEQ